MQAIDPAIIRQAHDKFPSTNILFIGDIIVDHFIWGSVSRISPEAPVPVVNVTRENLLLGGAANVLNNIYALGGKATICGIVGHDAMGNHFIDLLNALPSPTDGVIRSINRPTTLKTRIIAQHQQVVRFDREKAGPPSEKNFKAITDFIDQQLEKFDVVIVSDYAKGMISPQLMDHLRKRLQATRIPMVVDPKPVDIARFRGATIITPNNSEAEQMSGVRIESEATLLEAASTLQHMLDSEAILITRGEHGMALLEKGQPLYTIPTLAKEVYDVTGAGDTVIATLSLGLAAGLSFKDASRLANIAAGIVVGKVGTATTNVTEILEAL